MKNDSTSIFWFSGTGNSLYAAKCLAESLGGAELVQMTGEVPTAVYGGEGTKIGFVFPSYYCNMPRAVRAFVEKLEIKPGTYIFGIVTMGGMGQGTINALGGALEAKGLKLNYGRGLLMPSNYVIKYNPFDPGKSGKSLTKAEVKLRRFAADIAAGTELVRQFPNNGKNLYRDIEALDRGFAVSESCNSCGLCERICPVRNISIENGKPKWQGNCEHCVACISWCPLKAIEYENRTQSRRRYHCKHISADELART